MVEIKKELAAVLKEKPAADNPLAFGTIFTDHMFEMDYTAGTD